MSAEPDNTQLGCACGQSFRQQRKALSCWPRCSEGRVRRHPIKIVGIEVRHSEFVRYHSAQSARSRSRSSKDMYAGHRKWPQLKTTIEFNTAQRRAGERGSAKIKSFDHSSLTYLVNGLHLPKETTEILNLHCSKRLSLCCNGFSRGPILFRTIQEQRRCRPALFKIHCIS